MTLGVKLFFCQGDVDGGNDFCGKQCLMRKME
jgi:hypothetical protein